jgi:mannonate dehydratase
MLLNLGQGDLDRLLLGKEGQDAELDEFNRTLECMGKAGIPVLKYNLMASRVILTQKGGTLPGYWDNRSGRGGPQMKSFDEERAKLITEEPAGRITADQVWERITYFLKRCVPAAAAAGVYLACHPDDPPIPRHWGVDQVLFRMNALKQLIDIEPDKHNALVLCQGTIQEAGINVLDYIRVFGPDRIVLVELRGVRGLAPKYEEVFMDDGELSLSDVVRTLKESATAVRWKSLTYPR